MAFHHEMQSSRYELKYRVDEHRASLVREFCSGYLTTDEYADPANHNSYSISSIYLDSADLILYRQGFQGMKNRIKLRIRFYDDDPSHPAFLEIKRRVTDVILKERAMVYREAVPEILAGSMPKQTFLVRGEKDAKGHKAMVNFCQLRDELRARPWIFVSYIREAYAAINSNDVRVTFDRQINGCPYDAGTLRIPSDGAFPDMGGVVLEIKFTDRFPGWMHGLAMSCDLYRTNASKYNSCIENLQLIPEARRMGVKRNLAIGSARRFFC